MPKGKRANVPLRLQERQIAAALADSLVLNGGELTVVQLCDRYLATKVNVKPTTQTGYQTVMNILKSVPFGNVRIDKIRELDAQEFLVWLQQSEGKGYSTIHNVRGVLRPAFRMAVKNDYIRKTPFDFPLADVVVDDSVRR